VGAQRTFAPRKRGINRVPCTSRLAVLRRKQKQTGYLPDHITHQSPSAVQYTNAEGGGRMVEAEEMGEIFSLAEQTLTVTHP